MILIFVLHTNAWLDQDMAEAMYFEDLW